MNGELERRIAEATAWISSRLPAPDLGTALRTLDLQPPELLAITPNTAPHSRLIEELLGSPSRVADAVEHIVLRRRHALTQAGIDVIPVRSVWWDDDPPAGQSRLFT